MIRNTLQRFMYGRYGIDQLNIFLVAAYAVLVLLQGITGFRLLSLVAFAAIVLAFFRLMSRNVDKRREENAKFLHMVRPVVSWFHLRRTIAKDKEHFYFKCPNCGQQLRVPKGKGKISVTCRSCGHTFEAHS